MANESHFDGSAIGYLGVMVGMFLGSVFTLGIGVPWLVAWKQGWIASHTVIEGQRLCFVGTGFGVIWTWLKVFLLTIITIGIYAPWAWLTIRKWVVRNTVFA